MYAVSAYTHIVSPVPGVKPAVSYSTKWYAYDEVPSNDSAASVDPVVTDKFVGAIQEASELHCKEYCVAPIVMLLPVGDE